MNVTYILKLSVHALIYGRQFSYHLLFPSTCHLLLLSLPLSHSFILLFFLPSISLVFLMQMYSFVPRSPLCEEYHKIFFHPLSHILAILPSLATSSLVTILSSLLKG